MAEKKYVLYLNFFESLLSVRHRCATSTRNTRSGELFLAV